MARTGERESPGWLYSLLKIRAIAGNTFRESIRQPVVLILLASAAAMIALSPYYTFFTLLDSPKMIKEMGLATMLVVGLLIAAFSASSVVSREIEERTVLTVLAKPVGRVEFVVGKYLGVLLVLFVVSYVLTLVTLMTTAVGGFEAGALQTVNAWAVLGMVGTVIVVLIIAAVLNFKKGLPFASAGVLISIPAFTLCAIAFVIYQVVIAQGTVPEELQVKVDIGVVSAGALVMLALFVMGAIAVAASTRLNAVMTVVLCAGLFLLGLLSDYLFYPHTADHVGARIAYAVVPNLQVFWVADALVMGSKIPPAYVGKAAVYSACYMCGILFIGMLLFEDKQVS